MNEPHNEVTVCSALAVKVVFRWAGTRSVVLACLLLVSFSAFWVLSSFKPTLEKSVGEAEQQVLSKRAVPAEDSIPSPDAVTQLLQERKRLDDTVWKDEVLAQHYEDYFVKLWDGLRAASDQFTVFEKLSFEKLVLGQLREVSKSDWGIVLSECAGQGRELSSQQYVEELRELAESGLRIVQTEWHHARFEIGEPTGARSTVAIRIDAVNDVRQTRYTVTGDIVVQWEQLPDPAGLPVPALVDARGIRIMQRSGPVGFESQRKIDATELGVPVSVPSIIAYDLNGDGLSELLIPSANIVFRNLGDWNFQKLRLFTSPSREEITASVAGDFNGDGYIDVFCASAGLPRLYIADKDGAFPEPGKEVDMLGEPLVYPSVVTAGDVDGDGDLDIWLAQYKPAYHFGQMPTPYYDANDGFPATLLLNDGNGNFRDATGASGLADKRNRRTYGGALIDLDADRDLDLAVASDYAGLDLYFNNGMGLFEDVTHQLGENRHCFGMSLCFADFNLDGLVDAYMTGMASTTARRLERMGLGRDEFEQHQQKRSLMGYGNRMYLSTVDGFSQAPFNDQVARTGWSWGSSAFDFDNDGDCDIYVANGHRSTQTAKDYCTRFWTHDIYTGSSQHDPQLVDFFQTVFAKEFLPVSWNGFEHNCLLMNQAGKGFVNVAYLMDVAYEFDSRNVISDDFDGDGKKDLLVVGKAADQSQGSIYLVKNVMPTDNHWIGIHLREKGLGRSPLGARVSIKYPGGSKVAWIVSGDSLYSQHATTAHFGLGPITEVEQIVVDWPDGTQTQIEGPQIDRYHQVGN